MPRVFLSRPFVGSMGGTHRRRSGIQNPAGRQCCGSSPLVPVKCPRLPYQLQLGQRAAARWPQSFFRTTSPKDLLIEREVRRHETLQARVLIAQLPQLADLGEPELANRGQNRRNQLIRMVARAESNHRHADFQSVVADSRGLLINHLQRLPAPSLATPRHNHGTPNLSSSHSWHTLPLRR
jgi:hypothetical protein